MQKKKSAQAHRKSAHRLGEEQVGREQIAELLELSHSEDPEDRHEAASHLCPCHVRTRIPAVWDALFRLMDDPVPRVRQQAWHTIEDGGKPADEEGLQRLEAIYARETEPKIRKFAEATFRKIGHDPLQREKFKVFAAGLRPPKRRGKCDFCGEDKFVELDTTTMIPTGDLPRAALICEACARTV